MHLCTIQYMYCTRNITFNQQHTHTHTGATYKSPPQFITHTLSLFCSNREYVRQSDLMLTKTKTNAIVMNGLNIKYMAEYLQHGYVTNGQKSSSRAFQFSVLYIIGASGAEECLSSRKYVQSSLVGSVLFVI